MLDFCAGVARHDIGNGVRTAFITDQQRVTLGEVSRIFSRGLHMDQPAIAVL